jgi:hypothetical protein
MTTSSEAYDHGTPQDRRAAKLSWLLWMAVALIGIWLGVLLISLLAPDLVTGSRQQHQPLATFMTWFEAGSAHRVLVDLSSSIARRGHC